MLRIWEISIKSTSFICYDIFTKIFVQVFFLLIIKSKENYGVRCNETSRPRQQAKVGQLELELRSLVNYAFGILFFVIFFVCFGSEIVNFRIMYTKMRIVFVT